MNHLDFPPAVFQGLQHICTQCDHPCASLSPMTVSGEVASSQNKGMYDLQLHKATSSTFKKKQGVVQSTMVQNHLNDPKSSQANKKFCMSSRYQGHKIPSKAASTYSRFSKVSNLQPGNQCQVSKFPANTPVILLMEDILHHLGHIKPWKYTGINHLSTGAGSFPSIVGPTFHGSSCRDFSQQNMPSFTSRMVLFGMSQGI